MKSTLVIYFAVILAMAFAEPLRYRPAVRASAKQTRGGVAFQATLGETTTQAATTEKDDESKSVETADQPADQPAEQAPVQPPQQPAEVPFTTTSVQYWPSSPYYPKGWRPFGQLLVLPFAVRENVESTSTVESTTFDDETTEQTPTTEATKGGLETSEPKSKKTAAYTKTKTPLKFSGELKVQSKEASKESNDETSTTENSDETTTTEPKSGDLETTSEPDAESVNVQKNNEGAQPRPNAVQPQTPQQAYFIQLPDGTLQRIVYLAPETPNQAAYVQKPAQQLNQAPNYSFGFNPIANPRIVTFSTQYHAF